MHVLQIFYILVDGVKSVCLLRDEFTDVDLGIYVVEKKSVYLSR